MSRTSRFFYAVVATCVMLFGSACSSIEENDLSANTGEIPTHTYLEGAPAYEISYDVESFFKEIDIEFHNGVDLECWQIPVDPLESDSDKDQRQVCVDERKSEMRETLRLREEERELEWQIRLRFAYHSYNVPPEAALEKLVTMSCDMSARQVNFWQVADENYRMLIKNRSALARAWPPTLSLAYNEQCVKP